MHLRKINSCHSLVISDGVGDNAAAGRTTTVESGSCSPASTCWSWYAWHAPNEARCRRSNQQPRHGAIKADCRCSNRPQHAQHARNSLQTSLAPSDFGLTENVICCKTEIDGRERQSCAAYLCAYITLSYQNCACNHLNTPTRRTCGAALKVTLLLLSCHADKLVADQQNNKQDIATYVRFLIYISMALTCAFMHQNLPWQSCVGKPDFTSPWRFKFAICRPCFCRQGHLGSGYGFAPLPSIDVLLLGRMGNHCHNGRCLPQDSMPG